MSATLLLCALALGTRVAAAYVIRNGTSIITKVENETSPLSGNGFFVENPPNRRIVVEEVDKHGNSVVKELELPDYDEPQDDSRRTIQEWGGGNQRSEKSTENKRRDLYGCDNRRENQRRKCLQRRKKFLKTRYRNWKTLIRRIIKDLDGKIKTIGHTSQIKSTTENFTSGFSPKKVMRKKE